MTLTAKQKTPRYPSFAQMLHWQIGKLNINSHAIFACDVLNGVFTNNEGSFYSKRFNK